MADNTPSGSNIEPQLADNNLDSVSATQVDHALPARPEWMKAYQEPTEDERLFYYYGLRDNPQLLARTSTSKWEPTFLNLLGQVTQREYLPKWCDYPHKLGDIISDPEFITRIGQAAEGIRWVSIRCSYLVQNKDTGLLDPDKYPLESEPLRLIVAVERDGSDVTSWESAITAAHNCKNVLKEEYGIFDVECEIKEYPAIEGPEPVTFKTKH